MVLKVCPQVLLFSDFYAVYLVELVQLYNLMTLYSTPPLAGGVLDQPAHLSAALRHMHARVQMAEKEPSEEEDLDS